MGSTFGLQRCSLLVRRSLNVSVKSIPGRKNAMTADTNEAVTEPKAHEIRSNERPLVAAIAKATEVLRARD